MYTNCIAFVTLSIQATDSPFIFGRYSFLIFRHIQLYLSPQPSSSVISVIGNVSLSDVLLGYIDRATIIPPLVSFMTQTALNDYTSTVCLTNSRLKDLFIPHTSATFTSSGYSNIQQIINCNFENITTLELPTIKDDWAVSEQSIIRDTQILASEDTFYGCLVTGPTAQTLSSFASSNCTFTRCNRIHNPPSPTSLPFKHFLSSDDCSSTTTMTCTSTSHISYRGSIEFTDAKFSECTAPSGGGGLLISGSSSLLTLTRCSFIDCASTNTTKQAGGG